MKKRLLSLALALALVCALLPTVALAVTTTYGDFDMEGRTLLKYTGSGGDVVIPNGVTTIGKEAFRDCKSLVSITIPNGVTNIGQSVFSGCTGLTSVTIPDSVTTIDDVAFFRCTGLTSVTIGNGVTTIGDRAFSGCTSLTSVTIGNGMTSIGKEAFSGCTGLTSVTIPDSVTTIGDGAFSGCTGLTSITIPNGVTSIGKEAFSGCKSLTSLYYNGTKAQWNAIESIGTIGDYGIPLKTAIIHYNLEPITVPATDAPHKIYADVPDNAWYAEAVNAMTEGGLFTGYTDGLFHPDDPITYAQLVTILCRVMGLEAANPADTPEWTHWAQTAWDNTEYERPNLVIPGSSLEVIGYMGHYARTAYPEHNIDDNVCRGKVLGSLVKLASNMPIYNAKRYDNSLVPSLTAYSHEPDTFMFEQISPKIWTSKDIPDWKDVIKAEEGQIRIGNGINGGTILENSVNRYHILLAYNIGITKGIDANGTCDVFGDVTRAQLCQFLWNMGITHKNSVTKTQEWTKNKVYFPHEYDFFNGTESLGKSYYSNFEYFTNLQFYEVYPDYTSSHGEEFFCSLAWWHFMAGAHESSSYKCWDPSPTEKQAQSYELEKQAAYDEHEQWLKEFEGTRQWEIATGKI